HDRSCHQQPRTGADSRLQSVTGRLQDKRAILTGAGAGIGEAIAIRFAEEGARLVVADIQDAPGRATLDKITALGARPIFVQADISLDQDARRIAETAVS